MKKYFCFLLFSYSFLGFSQEKLSIENIWNGRFHSKHLYEIQNSKDGIHYTYLDIKHSKWQILKKNYANPLQEKVLAQGDFFTNYISSYKLSPNENHLLLEKEAKAIYRHSKQAIYELIDLKTQGKFQLFDGNPIRGPLFSSDESKIAFAHENNLYYQELKTKKVVQITNDGKANFILNGMPDWVYEEELKMQRAFDWSEDSKALAYLKFDESKVPNYELNSYKGDQRPDKLSFKYPKAGEENSKVSLHLYFLEDQTTLPIHLESLYKEKEFYVPKLFFNKFSNELWITTSNRAQNKLDVFSFDLNNKRLKNIFSYRDSHYIKTDELILEPISKNEFVFACDKDGFNHFYSYSTNERKLKAITKGPWEAIDYYGYNKKNKKIYYSSSQEGSIYKGIYSIGTNGKNKKKLSLEKGTNEAYFSSDFNYFINSYSTTATPANYTIVKTHKAKELHVLEDNNELKENLKKLNLSGIQFFEIPAFNKGPALDVWMLKPKDFDANKKYPVLMYVYGGPGSKFVEDNWGGANYLWFELLASKGYIIVALDGRGTGRKGRKFEKEAIYKNLGHYELIDQISAAKYLGNLDYIDKNRIGIWGWSYGGYMASLAILKAPEIFKSAIAVAPVTHWKFYDTIYTERYMGMPSENKEAYEKSSPLTYIQNLKGNYFIIHGDLDDNVHPQNSFEMINALIKEAKAFEMMIYPNNNHSIYKQGARRDLYTRMTKFILDKL